MATPKPGNHRAARHAPTNKKAAVEAQIKTFLDKFDPARARLIRQCRAEMRKILPTALELVYDNYNFFVIGYSSTDRASDCILSIAAAANGVALSFYHGATLPDPHHLLQGEGKQNRFIRLPTAAHLRTPAVKALIQSAVTTAATPIPPTGAGYTIIKSISAKQRPRRRDPSKPS